jgi:hypothetical protein
MIFPLTPVTIVHPVVAHDASYTATFGCELGPTASACADAPEKMTATNAHNAEPRAFLRTVTIPFSTVR